MVIVAGHIRVEPEQRDSYLADSRSVAEVRHLSGIGRA